MGYSGGFIAHYIEPLVYPAGMTPAHHLWLGIAVLSLNLTVCFWLVLAYKKKIKIYIDND